MRGKAAAELDAKIVDRDRLQFELLLDCAVASGTLGKPPRGLALEFELTHLADIGADHEAKDMLGVDAFGRHVTRKQRASARQ